MKRTLKDRGSRIETVAIKDLRPGPIRHVLTPEQEDRIRAFTSTFQEVFPCTDADAFDSFRRDMNPDHQIAIWERMAAIYKQHAPSCKTREGRKALFSSMLPTGQPPS